MILSITEFRFSAATAPKTMPTTAPHTAAAIPSLTEVFICENCELENVITDKYVRIRKGVRLIGTPQFPVIIRKGAVI